jgi:hypothetical protein
MLRDKRNILITKLEAISYNLTGLVRYRLVTGTDAMKLSRMQRDIAKMLKPYEGVSIVNDAGC